MHTFPNSGRLAPTFPTKEAAVPSIHAKNWQRTARGNSMLRHFWRWVNRLIPENIFTVDATVNHQLTAQNHCGTVICRFFVSADCLPASTQN
jgi:hypothetical protein